MTLSLIQDPPALQLKVGPEEFSRTDFTKEG